MQPIAQTMTPVSPLAPPRFVALDGYRFLAAACVALYHYNMDFALDLERWSQAPRHFYIMVDFFFLLSGFVIVTAYGERLGSWRAYGSFLRARVARLYPLHLLTLGLVLAMAGAAAMAGVRANNPELLRLSSLPANATLLHAWGVLSNNSFNVASWSISAEWFVYLLAPAFIWLVRRLRFTTIVLCVIALIAVMTAARQAAGLGPWYAATYDFGALRAVPTFLLGAALAHALREKRLPFAPRWWMAHALFAAALACAHFAAPTELAIAVFAALIAVTVECERNARPSFMRSRAMQTLGDASFSIYMLHVLCAVPILFVLRRYDLLGGAIAGGAALAVFAGVVAVSILMFHYFETPARRLLAGAGKKRNKSAAPDPAAQMAPAARS